ncbi:MAG: hypothetical protein ACK5ZC_13940 [Pirellulaceae bacterium]
MQQQTDRCRCTANCVPNVGSGVGPPPRSRRSWLAGGCQLFGAVLGLSVARATAATSWPHEVQWGRFHFHGDRPLGEAKQWAEHLEELAGRMEKELELVGADEPIAVMVLANQQILDRYLKRYFPEVGGRRSIFLRHQDRSQVFVCRHPGLVEDLRHEVCHALLHLSIPNLPVWIDEGIAEYYEVQESSEALHPVHGSRIAWLVRLGHAPSLKAMERDSFDPGSSSGSYGDAWGWIHFLMTHSEASRRVLVDHLAAMHAGNDRSTLHQRLEQSLGNPRLEFLRHYQAAVAKESNPVASAAVTSNATR